MPELNAELMQKITEAWKSNASITEIVEMIASAGLSTAEEDVEKVLAAVQAEAVKSICAQELDDSALQSVAGGGSGYCDGTADCDKNFKNHPEWDDRCSFANDCDQLFGRAFWDDYYND